MPKTMEDLGLYSDQPDATVDSILYDEADPTFVEVKFSDGRVSTMPASHAEAMPKTPVDPMTAGIPGSAPMGPPVAPPPAGPDPGFSAGPGLGGLPGGGLSPEDIMAEEQAAANVPPPQLVGTSVTTGTGSAQHDPMTDIVAPGSPGGMAPSAESAATAQTQTSTVEDPSVMGERIDAGIEESAGAEHLLDTMRYSSQRDSMDTELDARDAQAAEAARMARKAELERAEHERIYKAVEATPIDEDAFWSESPGRTAGAWIALALSGFLSGATRGQNPALGQMMQALDQAQDRWLANQQKSRDSQLRQREKLMGSAENARDTYRLQLSGIVEKRIQLEAQREGLQPPPALSTYIAKQGVRRAEAKNAIGSRVDESTTRTLQSEQKATAATGPVRRGDVVLQEILGPKYRELHEKALADKNLGSTITSATELQDAAKRLHALTEKYGGDLEGQNVVSWTRLGMAPLAARWGSESAKDQVEANTLLKQVKMAVKQAAGNTRLFDSNMEAEDFIKQLDTGEASTTLAALDKVVTRGNQAALDVASAYAPSNAQAYVDFVRSMHRTNPGVAGGGAITPTRVLRPAPAGGDPEAGAVEATTQDAPAGGGATRPLPEPTQPGQPQAWQPAIRAHAEEAGYNADALERVIRFESGGRPDIRNPSGATGLIQFMPSVFAQMKKPPGYENVTHDDLKDLTVEEQMPLVIAYLEERGLKPDADVGEYYLAVAAPGLLGKPDDRVAYKKGSKAWEQNPSWRPADGGDITAGSIRAKGRKL